MRTFAIILTILLAAVSAVVHAQAEEASCSLQAWVKDRDPNGLNVRDKPGTNGKVIATLKAGDGDDEIVVNVVGYSNGWIKISGGEKIAGERVFDEIGWVSAKMLETGTRGSDRYEGPVQLYAADNRRSKKVGTIPGDSLVQISGFKCGWLRVTHNGKSGWINGLNVCGNPVTNCN